MENLRPVCKRCNWSMGTRHMESFRVDLLRRPTPMELDENVTKMEVT